MATTKYIVNNASGQTINGESILPAYKVYTALLTQSGGEFQEIAVPGSGLNVGVSYLIEENSGYNFIPLGAPNNNIGTYFLCNQDIDTDTDISFQLSYNLGAPVVTVLENTIGNIWWTFVADGEYYANSDNIFPSNKTFCQNIIISSSPNYLLSFIVNDNYVDFICTDGNNNLNNTPIEIRVYN